MLYKLTLTPLTPIHIGSGNTIEPYEYVITEKLHKFYPENFISILNKSEQDEFLKLSMTNILGMREFVRKKSQGICNAMEYSFEVSPAALEVYENRLKNPKSDLSVYPCIRTQGIPYIPGSSLKGAIRTALLYEKVKKPVTEKDAKKLEAETFGYAKYKEGMYQWSDITEDPFKFIKISDSQKADNSTILRLVTVYTKGMQGWREDIPLLREVKYSLLFDNTSVTFTSILQIVESSEKNEAFNTGDIIRSCKNFYSLHLREEKKHLSSHSKACKWYQELQNREASLPENAFLVRLGWGSGFDGVTINYARTDRERKRSRRLAEDGIPLGWAEVTLGN